MTLHQATAFAHETTKLTNILLKIMNKIKKEANMPHSNLTIPE